MKALSEQPWESGPNSSMAPTAAMQNQLSTFYKANLSCKQSEPTNDLYDRLRGTDFVWLAPGVHGGYTSGGLGFFDADGVADSVAAVSQLLSDRLLCGAQF